MLGLPANDPRGIPGLSPVPELKRATRLRADPRQLVLDMALKYALQGLGAVQAVKPSAAGPWQAVPNGYVQISSFPSCSRPANQHPTGKTYPDWSRQGIAQCSGPDDYSEHWPTWLPATQGAPFAKHVVGSWAPVSDFWPAGYNDTVAIFQNVAGANAVLPVLVPSVGGLIVLPTPWTSPLFFPTGAPVPAPYPALDPFADPRSLPGAMPLGLPEKQPIPVPRLPGRRTNPNRAPSEQPQWGPPPVPRFPPELVPETPIVVSVGPGLEPGELPGELPAVGPSVTPAGNPRRPEGRPDKKLKSNLAKQVVSKAFHGLTEASDLVDSAYDALPPNKRLKYRPGKPILMHEKLGIVLKNIGSIDAGEFVFNVVTNEIEDKIIGALHAKASKVNPGISGVASTAVGY